jgi:lipopolysaccharide export system protein LptC
MKINIKQKLYNSEGKPFKVKSEDGKEKELTLKEVLVQAALAETDKDTKQKGSDFQIFLKLQSADKQVELENKNIVRLQKKLEQTHTTLIFGQVNDVLEGKENPLGGLKYLSK